MLPAARLSHCGSFYRRSTTAKMCFSVTSSQIPPCARSLCNYRCKLGGCGRLPDLLPPLPVNNTLPTTFHCLSWFCNLMPVSCGGQKGRRTNESHGITQIVQSSIYNKPLKVLYAQKSSIQTARIFRQFYVFICCHTQQLKNTWTDMLFSF